MRRLFFLSFMVLVGMIILLPGNGYSWNFSVIDKPEHKQKFYSEQVEIIVQFKHGAKPGTFKAWLNHKNITKKFEPINNGMRALVGPEDGLRVFDETLETTRDDKGVWFIKGTGKRGRAHSKGRNILITLIKGKRHRWDFDHKAFFLLLS